MKKISIMFLLIGLFGSSFATASSPVVSAERVGCFKFTESLKLGDGVRTGKTEKVKELQQSLQNSGYLTVTPTGYFGQLTLKAIKKYQKDNKISQTGYIGEKTRGVLRSHFCGQTPIAICDYAAPPEGCTYVPGANYNQETSCGMVLSCNSVVLEKPANCKVWYDGCNTCSKVSPKGMEMCTLMACFANNQNKPYCKEYFDTSILCANENKTYKEGESLGCLKQPDGYTACIADAAYVCRSGEWKIEGGGMPPFK